MNINVDDTVLAVDLDGPFYKRRVKPVKVLEVERERIKIPEFDSISNIWLDVDNNLDYAFIGWLPYSNLTKLLYEGK